MAQNTYQLISLDSNIDLTWPSSFTGDPVILDINDVIVLNDSPLDYIIRLPRATLVQTGQNFIFSNVTPDPFDFAIFDFAGNQVGLALESGDILQYYLIDNTTDGGTWRVVPFGTGTLAVTGFTANSLDSSIVITNGVITAPGGTVDFKLSQSLINLDDLNNVNFLVVRNKSPNLEFVTRQLVNGNGINITHGDGIDDNPTISISDNLNLPSATIGGISISNGNIIPEPGEDLIIGTVDPGVIDLNGVTIDQAGNIDLNGGSITGIGGLTSIRAYVNFTEDSPNHVVINNSRGVSAVEVVSGTEGTFDIVFTELMPNINYGVLITTGSSVLPGDLPVITHGYYYARALDRVTVIVTDAAGELVEQASLGVTVMIISS